MDLMLAAFQKILKDLYIRPLQFRMKSKGDCRLWKGTILLEGYILEEEMRQQTVSDKLHLQPDSSHWKAYLLHNKKIDRSAAVELGLPKLMMHLLYSDDSLVSEAALGALLELAQNKTSGADNALPKTN